jgi:signal transduction histidine kinase
MTHLDEILSARRDELLTRWQKRVAGTLAPETVSPPEILNSLPLFLDELVFALGRARISETGHPPLPEHSDIAAEHGLQRFRSGFSIQAVVREYGLLRECIIELLKEVNTPISLTEYEVLSHALSTGVADAVSRFCQERDHQLQQQAGEHLAFLAHELRNPILSARFALDLIRYRGTGGDERALQVIQRSLSRLQELIDRSLVEIRLRQMDIRRERIRLGELVREIAIEAEADAEIKGCALHLEVDDTLALDCDRRLIGSAVSNLIRNGIKFTRPGGIIDIRARVRDGITTIQVEDSCGGLPPGKVEELFTPFMQAGHDRRGFGLGLAIAKHAVEAHGGAIQVHNLPGKGCVFLITLPGGESQRTGDE